MDERGWTRVVLSFCYAPHFPCVDSLNVVARLPSVHYLANNFKIWHAAIFAVRER